MHNMDMHLEPTLSKSASALEEMVKRKVAELSGNEEVRGGTVFKTPLKLLESFDCLNCFHRFEMDTYGRGCTHNCVYCYAKGYLQGRGYWNSPIPFPIEISSIRKMFEVVFETDKPNRWRRLLENRVPIRLGSMSDSFMEMERQLGVTKEFLKVLHSYRYPVTIVTKSALVADPEYMQYLDPSLASVQISFTTLSARISKLLEPGAPVPEVRLKALSELRARGIWSGARINPLFPIFPDGTYSRPGASSADLPPLGVFSWDLVESICDTRAAFVIAGMVRLYHRGARAVSDALGVDILPYFGEKRNWERGAVHIGIAETEYYYRKIREICLDKGVRFSVCYIGNDANGESFQRFRSLWSNPDDCCDVLNSCEGIKNTCAAFPVDDVNLIRSTEKKKGENRRCGARGRKERTWTP